MDAEDDIHWTEARETPEQVRARARRFLSWLMQTPFDSVVLCGHSDFISNTIELVGHAPHWPANGEVVTLLLEGTPFAGKGAGSQGAAKRAKVVKQADAKE